MADNICLQWLVGIAACSARCTGGSVAEEVSGTGSGSVDNGVSNLTSSRAAVTRPGTFGVPPFCSVELHIGNILACAGIIKGIIKGKSQFEGDIEQRNTRDYDPRDKSKNRKNKAEDGGSQPDLDF